MYVKITNGSVDTYPYSVGQLRRDNPNTSFPKIVPNKILAEYNIMPVIYAHEPNIDIRTQKVTQEDTPSLVDGNWTIGWIIENKTTEEVQEYDDNMAANNRNKRNRLLAQSDWTQVLDAPVEATVWATYRQALRDITTHANWPHLEESDWPTKP